MARVDLSQDLETQCPKLAIAKCFNFPSFKGDHGKLKYDYKHVSTYGNMS